MNTIEVQLAHNPTAEETQVGFRGLVSFNEAQERLGYEVFGKLEDYPQGHTRFFLQKRHFVEGREGGSMSQSVRDYYDKNVDARRHAQPTRHNDRE